MAGLPTIQRGSLSLLKYRLALEGNPESRAEEILRLA